MARLSDRRRDAVEGGVAWALHSLRPQVERAIGGKTVNVDDKAAAAIGKKVASVEVEGKKAAPKSSR